MGKVIAGMTVSLDGYVSDRSGSAQSLSPDFELLHDVASFQEMIRSTGAVIMGRNTYEMVDPFMWINDDYEFQAPIFVLTHTSPEKYPPGNDKLTLTFVTDGIESAVSQAKQAANNKDIQVIGASTIQQCLNSGLCDELGIDLMPILLGKGLRLLENIDTDRISLERISVEEATPYRTSIRFKVTKTYPGV